MIRVVTAAALLCLPLAHANDERRNPFAHTLTEQAESNASVAEGADADELRLSAILVAGDASLVTLNGNVIGLGEEALGYELINVTEESAAFLRGDKVVHLLLFDGDESEYDHD